jgi:alanine racemase
MSTLITIGLDALEANYRYCSERIQPSTLAAVVKADAYGLGMRKIAPALHQAGCRQFFTATYREGATLRGLLPEAEVFVFESVTHRSVPVFLQHGLTPVLITPASSALWATQARALGRPLPAIIHIDTGMTRLGFSEHGLHQLLGQDGTLEWLDIRYVMTHFACADQLESGMTRRQLERFDQLRQMLPRSPTSIGNSAGSLLDPEFPGDMARLGIALYGGNPYSDKSLPLAPVLRVQSRILQVSEISAGTTVGYGATYSATGTRKIATVGIGYADGYPWSLGNKGIASVGGHRVPVVGRVSMDMIALDVTGVSDDLIEEGQWVDLIGPNVTLEEVADLAGTINYELLTRLSQRARRKYIR